MHQEYADGYHKNSSEYPMKDVYKNTTVRKQYKSSPAFMAGELPFWFDLRQIRKIRAAEAR